jgi:hypothetical protein
LLESAIKLVTLGSFIVGATAIYIALRNNNRQLGAQIFLAYTDRIHRLRKTLSMDGERYRLSLTCRDELTIEERRALLEACHLAYEFFALRQHRYMAAAIWEIWQPDIERLLRMPTVVREWPKLRAEFDNHPEFMVWVDRCQQKSTQSKESGATR